ncbi:MAG TPA: hypothetical protein VHL57_07800 [Flavobacteriales bacterium]|jgi:hypothetical protein|nr:hypothetical protein [Flavobacteriales bacterium]
MYALVLLAVLGVSILFLRDRTSSPAPLERAPTTVEPVDQARPAQPLDTARVFSGDTMRTTVR